MCRPMDREAYYRRMAQRYSELAAGLCSGASSDETEGSCRLADFKIGKVARHIGTVQAPDAEAAIRCAIEKFEIGPEHQNRIAARQVVLTSE